MKLVTKTDTKRFVQLLKIGLERGRKKHLNNYTSATMHEGIDTAKEYYVSLEFSFHCDPEVIEDLINSDSIDDEIMDMLGGLNK